MQNRAIKKTFQVDYLQIERPEGCEIVLHEQPQFLSELAEGCKKAGVEKVLILGKRVKVRMSTLDLLDLGERVARLGLKIAVVESHDASAESVDFLESVARNRGGALEFFDEEGSARQWLGAAKE